MLDAQLFLILTVTKPQNNSRALLSSDAADAARIPTINCKQNNFRQVFINFFFHFSTTEALKKVLEYDYMESKDDEQDDDENAQAQDDGKTQEGCGLGDGEAGQATTSDVTSEDMFDSAEKPKPNEDDQDQNQSEDQKDEQMPPKEEDGFDVDNVQDENPQEKEDEGNEQNRYMHIHRLI